MSKLFIHFLNDEQVAALKSAGHEVVTGIVSAAQTAEHTIIASPIGTQIAAMVHTVADKSLSGLQKAEQVLAEALPLVVSFAADGGVTLVASAESTARAVINTIYNGTVGAVSAATSTATAAK